MIKVDDYISTTDFAHAYDNSAVAYERLECIAVVKAL